jgi:hypothetical protein
MKIKVMLLAVLITIFQSANAKSIEYETGKKLALCAGKSKYIAFMLKDNESYVDAEYQSLKGERYKLASAYSFNKYGMKKDSSINHASEIMNEEYLLLAIKYSDFIKMPIGKSPTTLRYDKNDDYRINKLNEINSSSSATSQECIALTSTVKSYLRKYRENN